MKADQIFDITAQTTDEEIEQMLDTLTRVLDKAGLPYDREQIRQGWVDYRDQLKEQA